MPLVSLPAREMIVWQDAQVRDSLFQGMKEAAAGDLVDLGSFAQYVDEPDED